MAKKTRKQKILADHRHIQYHLEKPVTVSYSEPSKPVIHAQNKPYETTQYSYVMRDIYKTAVITASIVAFQLILFFLTRV